MKTFILIILVLFTINFSYTNESTYEKFKESYIFKLDNKGGILIIGIPETIPGKSNIQHTPRIYSYKKIINNNLQDFDNFNITITYNPSMPVHFLPFFSLGKGKDYIFYSAQNGLKGLLNVHKGEVIGSMINIATIDDCFYEMKVCFKNIEDKIIISSDPLFDIKNDNLSWEDFFIEGEKNGILFQIEYKDFLKIKQNKIDIENQIIPRYKDMKNVLSIEKKKKIKNLLIESSQSTSKDSLMNVNIPILLVDEKNYKKRADSEDWRIYAYMNKSNGDFFQYFFFEKELDYEWPLYIRDFAMDHLAGAHLCKKSTVLVNNKSHEKVFKQGQMRGNNPKDVYIHKIKGKQWRPAPVPKDKNRIPKNRLYFNGRAGRIFGSYAKVWELDVWQMLPNMLRDNPEGVYLIGYGTLLHLNECKTPYEEQALLKKCGVLITPQIYKELQSLRRLEQSQSPTTKK